MESISEAVLGSSQDKLVSAARQHAMWLLRTHLGISYWRIGRRMGRDHATVRTGVEHHVARMQGRMHKPFVWTPEEVLRIERLLRDGLTLSGACREMGIARNDFYRCPDRYRIGRLAQDVARARRWGTVQ